MKDKARAALMKAWEDAYEALGIAADAVTDYDRVRRTEEVTGDV